MQSNNSIVLELQREALDETTRTSALLRKALVVAKKLKLKDFEQWADKELQGYDPLDKCPEYRTMKGDVKAWNSYHGCWVPVYFESAEQAESYSTRPCGQAIPELEGFLPSLNKPTTYFAMPFPKDIELELVKSMHPLTKPQIHIQPMRVLGIVETVRTIILNWTLKLEEEGILGERLTFTSKEQEKASTSSASHITNFYGTVGQSQIQQHSPNAIQIAAGDDVIVADAIYIEQVKALVPKIKDAIEKFGLDKSQVDEVKSEIETIEAQVRSPKPKRLNLASRLFSECSRAQLVAQPDSSSMRSETFLRADNAQCQNSDLPLIHACTVVL